VRPPEDIAAVLRIKHVVDLAAGVPGLVPFWGDLDHLGNELQRYRPSAIHATRTRCDLVATPNGDKTWTSGACTWGFDHRGLVDVGDYIEGTVSCSGGEGVWPALWLMPQANPTGGPASSPELDVVELVGAMPGHSEHHVHYNGADLGAQQRLDWSQPHRYGMHVMKAGVGVYVDGVRIHVFPPAPWPTWPGGLGIIWNLAVGGWGGNPTAKLTAVATLTDLVVWQPA
jgi:hypothetical protein